jgi:hypothetical protein
LYERFLRNFTREGIPKGERLEALNVDLILSPEETDRDITVPVCSGVLYLPPVRWFDATGSLPCVNCNAHDNRRETVRVSIPPMVPDNHLSSAHDDRVSIIFTFVFEYESHGNTADSTEPPKHLLPDHYLSKRTVRPEPTARWRSQTRCIVDCPGNSSGSAQIVASASPRRRGGKLVDQRIFSA